LTQTSIKEVSTTGYLGYSGTPLVKKLGIKEGFRVGLVNPPNNFLEMLGSLPENVKIAARLTRPLDLIMIFSASERSLKRDFPGLAGKLAANGMLWVAWPKKSSGVRTDLSFDNVQSVGLQAGLVDVKICTVDEVWSGLKFVYRLEVRPLR
jgi:hypothetical protein